MTFRSRLGRAERTVRSRDPGPDPDAPLVVLHLPISDRDGRPPGEYPMGPNMVMKLYDPAADRPTEPAPA